LESEKIKGTTGLPGKWPLKGVYMQWRCEGGGGVDRRGRQSGGGGKMGVITAKIVVFRPC